MVRFAKDCMESMTKLTQQLESVLGPDTADLQLRVGLHSGPVTAGVLRGEKGRFQLFGDTVNTASRMESNGKTGRIQASETTAKLLMAGGKEKWVEPRSDKIQAKGKGYLQTYWINIVSSSPGSSGSTPSRSDSFDSTSDTGSDDDLMQLDSKSLRLIDWNIEMLARFLRKVVNRRTLTPALKSAPKGSFPRKIEASRVIDEFVEVLDLLEYGKIPDAKTPGFHSEEALSPEVMKQLREYVTSVCNMYNRENPFHNFEHARYDKWKHIRVEHFDLEYTLSLTRLHSSSGSHVTMSVGTYE